MRRAAVLGLTLILATIVAGCAEPPEMQNPVPRVPASMAALGDSITRGMNLDGAAVGEHPEASWATGTASLLANASHAARLLAMGGLADGIHNLARSGARVDDFARQAQLAVEARAEYVTVLFGANDACAPSVARMTSVEDFRADFREGARILVDGLPSSSVVFVASVPDIRDLWSELHENERAQTAWQWFRVCQALLSSTATADDRAAVAERVAAYNEVLREESGAFGFAFDDGAVHEAALGEEDVSDFDYFHPSFRGQLRLANATWMAGPFSG